MSYHNSTGEKIHFEKSARMIHPSAEVSPKASIGKGASIWHHAQVREGADIGANCIIGKGVYVDTGVRIGQNVKVQNYACIYHGVTIEEGVFVGPHVCFTNDLHPRAVNPDLSLKGEDDWSVSETHIRRGASVGANSTIVCGITIGEWAMIGAGALVTHDVPDYGLVYGNPARLCGFVCPCGGRLDEQARASDKVTAHCPACGRVVEFSAEDWSQIVRL